MKELAPMLIGMNPLEHEVIWQKMYRNSFFGKNAGPVIFGAISAFDIALWDLKENIIILRCGNCLVENNEII